MFILCNRKIKINIDLYKLNCITLYNIILIISQHNFISLKKSFKIDNFGSILTPCTLQKLFQCSKKSFLCIFCENQDVFCCYEALEDTVFTRRTCGGVNGLWFQFIRTPWPFGIYPHGIGSDPKNRRPRKP